MPTEVEIQRTPHEKLLSFKNLCLDLAKYERNKEENEVYMRRLKIADIFTKHINKKNYN